MDQIILKVVLRGSILLLAGFLAACASQPQIVKGTESDQDSAIAGERQPSPTASFSEPLLFDLLLGEIAGQRQQMDTAVSSYIDAAQTAQDPRVAERAVRIAAFAKQDEKALIAARRWVELDSVNLEAMQVLAILELRFGDGEQGIVQLERIIETESEHAAAYERVFSALALIPNKQLSLEVIQKIVSHHPGDAEAHFAQSRLAANGGQLDLALESIERALELRGYWTRAEVIRADILLNLDQRPRATENMRRAVKQHPDDIDLRLAYARILVDSRDLEEASRQFKKVSRQSPDNTDVLFSLALLALESDQLEEARGYLLRVNAAGKRNQDVSYYLGRIAEQEGRQDDALDWYAKVSQGQHWLDAQIYGAYIQAKKGDIEGAREKLHVLRNGHPQFVVQFVIAEGSILTKALRYEEAFDLYSEYLDQLPRDTELRYVRALIAEKLDRLDLAETDLLHVLDVDPKNAAALNALGYTLADRTDRFAEAERYIVMAMELLPDDPAVIDSMGWLQYRRGNLEAAVRHLKRAFELSGDGEIGAHLGEVLWQMGDQNQARKIWEEARGADPDNSVLKEVLKRYLP